MTATETSIGIPGRRISAAELPEVIASEQREAAAYEQRYEPTSVSMAELVDRDAIVPSIDIIK